MSRYFEDLEIGETTRSPDRLVTAEAMIEFARQYDPQYFHVDADAATQSPFGGLIGSGIYTAALWRILDHTVNGQVAFICGVVWENVRWAKPLRPGNVIHTTSVCTAKRLSSTRPGAGVVTFHHEVVNQNNEAVLAFNSVDLVHCAPRG